MTIIIDLETTGLDIASAALLEQQPYITELYVCKIDEEFNIIDDIETFLRPPIPISPLITKLTGITDAMVKSAPKFNNIVEDLIEFFYGERIFVAHNVGFDATVLFYEVLRTGNHTRFPWPSTQHCTVELSMHIKGHRLKLSDLHELATGKPHEEGAHRAKADVLALLRCYKWLMANEQ